MSSNLGRAQTTMGAGGIVKPGEGSKLEGDNLQSLTDSALTVPGDGSPAGGTMGPRTKTSNKLPTTTSEFVPVGKQGVLDLNEQATLLVNKVTAPIDFDGHIFNAEVKPNGNVVGGHSTATGDVQVIPGTASVPNAQGVYSARIEVADPNNPGQFLPKSNNGGVSTLFPDSWTADRIKVEVDAAFKNRTVVGNKWTGTTPSGVRVEGFLSPKTTVYPKL